MKSGWIIGIDGGGTKTSALARQISPTSILRRSEAGPCSIAAMTPSDAFANVKRCTDALNITPEDVVCLCIGVAGFSAIERRKQFISLLHSLFRSATIDLVPDYVVAHEGAFRGGSGVVVIAGTGSISYGVNPAGETALTGGYGYLVDDAGTGYGLGRLVIAAAGKSFDGNKECNTLASLFSAKTGIENREGLISAVYGGELDRVSIAALATLVSEASASGDKYASSLLMHAGGALARIAQAAIGQIMGAAEPVSVSKVGSLWLAGDEMNAVFERSIIRSYPSAVVTTASASPVEGALARALLDKARAPDVN